ncbi:MAG: hypothetical protein IJZ37_06740 [Clostridia bacterium]|nr:hypothetical protein [Clostridia bacterium]MBQ8399615.1 hypothetical protein [Clostridia bacterium]
MCNSNMQFPARLRYTPYEHDPEKLNELLCALFPVQSLKEQFPLFVALCQKCAQWADENGARIAIFNLEQEHAAKICIFAPSLTLQGASLSAPISAPALLNCRITLSACDMLYAEAPNEVCLSLDVPF